MKRKMGRRPLPAALAALALVGLACTCSPLGLNLGGGGGGALGDYVWFDANGDGLQDSEEQGIRGVTVRLLDAEGQTLQETQTDNDGFYGFSDVESGEYVIEFIPPPEMEFTLQDEGEDDAVDSDARMADGLTEAFSHEGEDDTRDAGLVEAAQPTPTATVPPATATPTAAALVPGFFITYEHTAPGSYSEIVIKMSGLEPEQMVEGVVVGPAVEGGGAFSAVPDAEGNASARVRITAYGTYTVEIPGQGVTQQVIVTADNPTATPES